MLTELTALPEGFLDAKAADLHTLLSGPTLIHLPGRRQAPLFVSVLLHGNEDTGLQAIQYLLANYQDRALPRALSLFIGNVSAAREGVRRLPDQPDYNRVWPLGVGDESPEHKMMQQVTETMAMRKVFASIDIHNNTGLNPHYACVNSLDNAFLQLATLFSRIVVYFTSPVGVQSGAFAKLCPSVTLECGKPGLTGGAVHAAEYVDAVMHLTQFPEHSISSHDIDLFHTVATVKVPDKISLGVDDASRQLSLLAEVDHYNFRELKPGTHIADVHQCDSFPLEAWNEVGNDIATHYFGIENGKVTTRRHVMPAMLTRNIDVIRQDCLCYLMERLSV